MVEAPPGPLREESYYLYVYKSYIKIRRRSTKKNTLKNRCVRSTAAINLSEQQQHTELKKDMSLINFHFDFIPARFMM